MLWIVFLSNKDREEEGIDAALLGAGQIELTIIYAIPDITTVIELTIDGVYMRIESEDRGRAQQSR